MASGKPSKHLLSASDERTPHSCGDQQTALMAKGALVHRSLAVRGSGRGSCRLIPRFRRRWPTYLRVAVPVLAADTGPVGAMGATGRCPHVPDALPAGRVTGVWTGADANPRLPTPPPPWGAPGMVARAGLTWFSGTPPAAKNWDAVCPGTTVGIRRVTPRIPWARAWVVARRPMARIQVVRMGWK